KIVKQLAKLALVFILIVVFSSSHLQADDEYVIAYRTIQVSDGDIELEFLEKLQSDLLDYDINIRFVRWHELEERPENALVYISFREELEEGVIVDTQIHLFTQSQHLNEVSPIL